MPAVSIFRPPGTSLFCLHKFNIRKASGDNKKRSLSMNGIDWDSSGCDVTWCWEEVVASNNVNLFPPGVTHGSSRSVFQSQPAAIIVQIEDFFLLYLLMPMKKERSESERTCLFVSVVLCTHIIQLVHLKGKLIFFFGRPSGMNEKIRFTFLGRMIGIHPNLFPFFARLRTLLISLIYILTWVIKFGKLQTTTECSTRPKFNGKTEISLGGNARSI